MRYDNPELRDRLAGEYVLGTMPPRARRRFERLMASEPEVARLVAEWSNRFAPLDAATPAEMPPARVWQAIERRLPAAPLMARPSDLTGWLQSLAFWRNLAVATSGALAALLLYIAVVPNQPPPQVIAVLADNAGEPGWIALGRSGRGEVRVSAVRPLPDDKTHAYELWAIAGGGAPRPLGLLSPRPERALALADAQMPSAGAVLAVSLEPPNGSPTGLPTGPVLYQGKLFTPP